MVKIKHHSTDTKVCNRIILKQRIRVRRCGKEGKVVAVPVMKEYRANRGKAPLIRNLGTR